MTEIDEPLPTGAVIVTHRVADFDQWKAGFDDHEFARQAAGFLGHHINRGENDPHEVTVYMPLSDVDRAHEFVDSDDLEQVMEKVGVVSAPEFLWTTPLREQLVWDRELPAVLITHHVDDMRRWFSNYNGADELRVAMGIIGHATNQAVDDPTLAVIYHQAESFDVLREFVGDISLRAVMRGAGVASEPELRFLVGGWGKRY